MAKKVVATLKKVDAKGYSKVIRMVKSHKNNGAYMFKEEIMPSDDVKEYLAKK
jgi:hypothetical protein